MGGVIDAVGVVVKDARCRVIRENQCHRLMGSLTRAKSGPLEKIVCNYH